MRGGEAGGGSGRRDDREQRVSSGSGRRDGREQRAESEVESKKQRVESEVESSTSSRVLFWKMVYGNFFRKPFSFFSFTFLRSNTNVFQLIFILCRNKRLQILKTFSAETN